MAGHRFEREFQLIFDQPQVAHPPLVLPLIEVGKDSLDRLALTTLRPIALLNRPGERIKAVGLFQNVVGHACLGQPGLVLSRPSEKPRLSLRNKEHLPRTGTCLRT